MVESFTQVNVYMNIFWLLSEEITATTKPQILLSLSFGPISTNSFNYIPREKYLPCAAVLSFFVVEPSQTFHDITVKQPSCTHKKFWETKFQHRERETEIDTGRDIMS